ncbi:hypothetical protein P4131_00005, partial [Pseudomonas aeruginosa]|nr:hypothetical protein [Pseudomonas aeruginosa]
TVSPTPLATTFCANESDQADQLLPIRRDRFQRCCDGTTSTCKIAGYRELTQDDITTVMNRVKAVGAELLALQAALAGRLSADSQVKQAAAKASSPQHRA